MANLAGLLGGLCSGALVVALVNDLFNEHRGIAYGIAAKYRIPGMGRDDVNQEALSALWTCIETYDPAKGSFAAFARTCIERQLIDLLRSATRREKRLIEFGRSLAVPLDASDAKERLDEIVAGVESLTEVERRALAAHLNGVPATASKAHNSALTRARAKLAA